MIPSNPYSLAFLFCAISFFIVATIVMYAMTGKVNARLPDAQRFSYIGPYFAKNRRIAAAYRTLFPKGRLLWSYRICVALGIVFIILTAHFDK